jgi:hypothetical protein
MKVALASSYRAWMLALFAATPGVGTVVLWWSSLSWPVRIDADGMTLRRHRRLPWGAISRIGVSRSYLDGHVCEMRIHHHGGSVARIPVRDLRNGEQVAGAILTMFKRARGNRPTAGAQEIEQIPEVTGFLGHDSVSIKEMSRNGQATRRTDERVCLLTNSNGDRG